MAVEKNLLLRAGSLTGAYLINSPGKGECKEYTKKLMRRVLCASNTGCGVCKGCIKFDTLQHVDVLYVEGNAKKVDFDYIGKFLSVKPMEGRFIVCIDNAHEMSVSCANSILKILEEKSKDVLFLLTTTNISAVLATIRSRCMAVRLSATPRSEVLSSLERQDDRAKVAAALSGGYKNQALVLLEDDDYENLRQDVLTACEQLFFGQEHPIVIAGKLSAHADIAKVFEVIHMFLSDIFREKAGCDTGFYTPDREQIIKKCAESFTYARIYNMMKVIAESSTYKNRNARLAYEQAFLNISEVR